MSNPIERQVDITRNEVTPALQGAAETLARAVYGPEAAVELVFDPSLATGGHRCVVRRSAGGDVMFGRNGYTPRLALAGLLSDITNDERAAATLAEHRSR